MGIVVVLIVLVLTVIVLAPLFARLLQLYLSRQRDYLADALQMIFGDREAPEVADQFITHLHIANPIKEFEKRAEGLFSIRRWKSA
ncbi:MAG TPA: hypothetical protein VK359_06200 [Rubrobacteraceae bacterium]|jgi:heat shock protein HtpX|nr:hypothetical protein [Rubrobacteraceae bacterium]HLL57499.1 hypothetical protein [Rubrobacteraceae bacterium]